MNRQEFLKLVSKEIHFIFDRKSIEKELNEHLEDSIADLQEEGFSREEAETLAVAQMGEPEEIGKLLNQEHHPILGYVWMISRVMVIAVAILALVVGAESLQSALDLLAPTFNIRGHRTEEYYPVQMKFETKTHNITIDYVGRTEYIGYYITYRAKTKFEYIRSVTRDSLFTEPYDPNDWGGFECNQTESWGRIGETGHYLFEWPDDNILRLQINEDNIVELDLEEYWR